MPTWDLFQRMLKTPAKDLPKIRAAIESRYSNPHESSEVYSVLDGWKSKEDGSSWISERDLIVDEEVKRALIEAGLL